MKRVSTSSRIAPCADAASGSDSAPTIVKSSASSYESGILRAAPDRLRVAMAKPAAASALDSDHHASFGAVGTILW